MLNIKAVVDGDWAATPGDLTFDPARFTNLSEVIEVARSREVKVSLAASPHMLYRSDNFHQVGADSSRNINHSLFNVFF